MIRLNELIEFQKITGESDVSIIKKFFIQNDMEEDAIKMLAELSEAKVNKLNNHVYRFQTWASCLPSDYLYKNYDLDIAIKLHELEIDYLAYNCKLEDQKLEWAKENVPKINEPEIYFQPLVKYLKEQGIEFMHRDKPC